MHAKQRLTFVAIVIAKLATVARVVAVDGIAGCTLGNQATVCAQDVVMHWTDVLTIIKKKGNILICEAVDIL